MSANVFLDTCILVYAFVAGDPHQQRALEILDGGGTISVQVLNELANTCRKKLRMDWDEITVALESVKVCCAAPIPLTVALHQTGMRIARRYGFSVYDGLIVAAALEWGCGTLYTEDLQHGQLIDGLHIENPFLPTGKP